MLLYSIVTCGCSNGSAIDGSTDDDSNSDDNNGVNVVLVMLLAVTVIGLVISIVIIVFLVVQRKQSRFAVTNMHFVSLIYNYIVVDVMLALGTVMSRNQCQATMPLQIPQMSSHLSQSMKLLL